MTKESLKYQSAAFASLLFCAAAAHAQTGLKPKWEVGAGFAVIDFPVYRGAQERRSYLLPVPFLAYRGEILQVNRERVRGLLFRRDRVEMDISVNGSVPTKSSDSAARQGMPDLEATLEVGPSLNAHLYYSQDRKINFDLRLPLRAAIASDFTHAQHVGWLFQPQLNLDVNDIHGSGWNLGVLGGVIFSDRRYHGYFYNVDPQYVTAVRPAYTAGGGYAGTQFIMALSKRFRNHWMGGFMKWDDLDGAVFAGSPLVTSKQYFTAGFSVTWILDKSDQMVKVSGD